jgi:hypothetical protein
MVKATLRGSGVSWRAIDPDSEVGDPHRGDADSRKDFAAPFRIKNGVDLFRGLRGVPIIPPGCL